MRLVVEDLCSGPGPGLGLLVASRRGGLEPAYLPFHSGRVSVLMCPRETKKAVSPEGCSHSFQELSTFHLEREHFPCSVSFASLRLSHLEGIGQVGRGG